VTSRDGVNGVPELILACHGGRLRIFHFELRKLVELTGSLGLGRFGASPKPKRDHQADDPALGPRWHFGSLSVCAKLLARL
jgi:hypothetical protein